MITAMPNLSVKKIQSLKKAGMHGDGSGLYLNVAAGGTKSWILRVTVKGQDKRREIGLEGAYFRSDLFERRRALMDAWGRHATSQSGDVVELFSA